MRWFHISQWTWDKIHHRTILFYFTLSYFIENSCWPQTQLHDKWDDSNFAIINFPFICSNIPLSPAYCRYISSLIWYVRACSAYDQFLSQDKLLTYKQVDVKGISSLVMSSFCKFYGRCNDQIYNCKLSLSQLLSDIFHLKKLGHSWHTDFEAG
jgi:hypothetical protein